MYSIVLMAAMTGGQADVPQGLLFARGGCSGPSITQTATVRVRNVVQTTVVRPLATLCANRPHILAHVFAPRSGCSGVVTARAGCSGTVALAEPGCVATVTFVGPHDQNAKFLGERITRAAVHRQLKVALAKDTSPKGRALKASLDADPDLYDVAVIKVTRDLKRTQLPADVDARTLGVIGDGHILQLLLDNLPAIIDAVLKIIAALGG